LGHHCVGYLEEASDVGGWDVAARLAEDLGCPVRSGMVVHYDLVKLLVDLLGAPEEALDVLGHL